MSVQERSGAAAVVRLRLALERTATALARPDLETLLASEADIEIALAEITALTTLPVEERDAARVEIEGARRALLRCRRLGGALDNFVRISFEAQGRTEYGPRRTTMPYAGQALDARV
jgi:hypothetical protein